MLIASRQGRGGAQTPPPLRPAPQVETKTRHEIEQKKQQLRQVVGDSYRQAPLPRRLRLPPLGLHLVAITLFGAACPPSIPLPNCRDLISSADTIIDISRSCHRLVDLSGGLQVRRWAWGSDACCALLPLNSPAC